MDTSPSRLVKLDTVKPFLSYKCTNKQTNKQSNKQTDIHTLRLNTIPFSYRCRVKCYNLEN